MQALPRTVAAQRVSVGTALGIVDTISPDRRASVVVAADRSPSPSFDADWESSPDDDVWRSCSWLAGVLPVPEGVGTWPRLMSAPHPRAVGSLGPGFVTWCREVRGVELRWWQRLTAYRLLEVDASGSLVWAMVLLSTPRQVGKSVLFACLAHWRIAHGHLFGQEQLAMHIGKDLQVCREVQRPARVWARAHRASGWNAQEANGKEQVSAPDGSRWMVRARDATYGYSTTLGMVDEAWDVDPANVDEGLEPSLGDESRVQPQLLLTSTAHRRATPLMPSRRESALAELREPTDVLLIEWSARLDADLEDRAAWRQASPQWSPQREQLLATKIGRALAGEGDVTDVDDDPVESFRSQYLNVWAPPAARLLGRDEPLVGEAVWDSLGDVMATPGSGPLVVAIEDYFGLGAAAAAAAWEADGDRVLVWGAIFTGRAGALAWAEQVAASRPGSSGLVGGTLAAWLAAAQDPASLVYFDPAGAAQTRTALPALRDLVAGRRIVHDGGASLSAQVVNALVVPGALGLSLSPRMGRSDVLRAAAWAAQRLVDSGAAQPFRVM